MINLRIRLLEGIRHDAALVLLMSKILFGLPKGKPMPAQSNLGRLLGATMRSEGLPKEDRNC